MDHEGYKDYYIGGEDIGWSIDERLHTNGTKIYYTLSGDDIANNKNDIASGASKWSGIVNIVNQTGSVTGQIIAYNNPGDTRTAVSNMESDSSGHLTNWTIKINLAYTVSATTIAHEFGHIIGLNDLYWTKNYNKLMCGYRDVRTVTGPSTSDKLGAQVITGQHTSHTWGYKYYNTTSSGTSRHVKYCTVCNGYCSSSNGKDPLISKLHIQCCKHLRQL